MSETSNAITTIDSIDSVLEDEGHVMVESADTVDADVVSDVVENEEEAEATTQPRRGRGRPKGSRNKTATRTTTPVETREVAPPEPTEDKPALTRAKAERLTQKIRDAAINSTDLFIEAWNSRIWLSYGDQYRTGKGSAHDFLEWVNVELAEDRPRLPKAKRLELVASIKNEGRVSQSIIAEIVGMDQKTVSNDLREAEESGTEIDRESVGEDGKTYTRSRGRTGMEKPFDVKLHNAVENLHNRIGDLTELRAMDPEQWAVEARAYRQELSRAAEELLSLRDSLEEDEDFETEVPASQIETEEED